MDRVASLATYPDVNRSAASFPWRSASSCSRRNVAVRCAGDVAGAPSAGADPLDRLPHRCSHQIVLPHPEIVVRAPDGDRIEVGSGVPESLGVVSGLPLEISKHAVPSLRLQIGDPVGEEPLIVHPLNPAARAAIPACSELPPSITTRESRRLPSTAVDVRAARLPPCRSTRGGLSDTSRPATSASPQTMPHSGADAKK